MARVKRLLIGGAGTGIAINSITGNGSPLAPFQLINDQATPGPNMEYATDDLGNKGWFPSAPTHFIDIDNAGFLALLNSGTGALGWYYINDAPTTINTFGVWVLRFTPKSYSSAYGNFQNADFQDDGDYTGIIGFTSWQGEYDSTATYSIGDVVISQDNRQNWYHWFNLTGTFDPLLQPWQDANWGRLDYPTTGTADTPNGYVTQIDTCGYVATDNQVTFRHDMRRNISMAISWEGIAFFGNRYSFPWGNNNYTDISGDIFQYWYVDHPGTSASQMRGQGAGFTTFVQGASNASFANLVFEGGADIENTADGANTYSLYVSGDAFVGNNSISGNISNGTIGNSSSVNLSGNTKSCNYFTMGASSNLYCNGFNFLYSDIGSGMFTGATSIVLNQDQNGAKISLQESTAVYDLDVAANMTLGGVLTLPAGCQTIGILNCINSAMRLNYNTLVSGTLNIGDHLVGDAFSTGTIIDFDGSKILILVTGGDWRVDVNFSDTDSGATANLTAPNWVLEISGAVPGYGFITGVGNAFSFKLFPEQSPWGIIGLENTGEISAYPNSIVLNQPAPLGGSLILQGGRGGLQIPDYVTLSSQNTAVCEVSRCVRS